MADENKFDSIIENYSSYLTEAGIQTDPAATELPGLGEEPPPQEPAQPPAEMDDVSKVDIDPNAYIDQMLEQMSNVTVEAFNNYIDNFVHDLTAVDGESLKQYYNTFASEAERFLSVKDQFKSLFAQLNQSSGELSKSSSTEPNAGQGGVNGSGPNGPGV